MTRNGCPDGIYGCGSQYCDGSHRELDKPFDGETCNDVETDLVLLVGAVELVCQGSIIDEKARTLLQRVLAALESGVDREHAMMAFVEGVRGWREMDEGEHPLAEADHVLARATSGPRSFAAAFRGH